MEDNLYFRIYFDTVEQDISTVRGLDEMEVNFERGKTSKGFFVKYVQKLRFYKTTYDYIWEQFLETGGCGSIDVVIEYRCNENGEFETLIEGAILLSNVEFDEKLCEALADIEDNSVNQLFMDYADRNIDLEAGSTMNGNSLASIRTELQNFFTTSGSAITQTLPAYGFTFYNAFDHILNYITDGRLRLASDFFSTLAQNKIVRVLMAGNPANGTSVTFYFTRFLTDSPVTAVVNSNGTATTFADRVVYALAALGYNTTYNIAGSNFSFDIEMNAVDDILDGITTSSASTFAVSDIQDYVQGGEAVYITNGHFLRYDVNAEKHFEISFNKLFEIADNLYDLSFAIEKTGSQYYLRIEPMEYFFDNAVTLTLNKVPGIKIKPDKDRTKSSVRIGGDGVGYYFENLSCGGQIDKKIDAITSQNTINGQVFGSNDEGDSLFVIEGKGLSPIDEPKDYVRLEQGAMPVTTEVHIMNNVVMGGTALLAHHLFFLPDSVMVQSIPVGTPKQFLYNADFEFPLRFSEFQSLTGFSQIAFNKYTGADTERLGYIDDLKYHVRRSMATFNLIVK